MRKRITLAVMAIMLCVMTAANAGAEGTQEPPTLLWIAGEETEKQWAEMLGFQEPLKSLVAKQNYDSYIDLIKDYQPDFLELIPICKKHPKHSTKPVSLSPLLLQTPCWRKLSQCHL